MPKHFAIVSVFHFCFISHVIILGDMSTFSVDFPLGMIFSILVSIGILATAVDKLGRFQHIKPEVEIEQRIFISNI